MFKEHRSGSAELWERSPRNLSLRWQLVHRRCTTNLGLMVKAFNMSVNYLKIILVQLRGELNLFEAYQDQRLSVFCANVFCANKDVKSRRDVKFTQNSEDLFCVSP